MNIDLIIQTRGQLPILLTDGIFVFPKCSHNLPLYTENEAIRNFFVHVWKKYQGRLIIVSSKHPLNKNEGVDNLKSFYEIGTLGKISLGSIDEKSDVELIFRHLKE